MLSIYFRRVLIEPGSVVSLGGGGRTWEREKKHKKGKFCKEGSPCDFHNRVILL
jgi:hypothetical protein